LVAMFALALLAIPLTGPVTFAEPAQTFTRTGVQHCATPVRNNKKETITTAAPPQRRTPLYIGKERAVK
jgi:hypothetical protein